MVKTVFYIDGENLKHYLREVLVKEGIQENKTNIENFNFSSLFEKILKGFKLSERRFYSARVKIYQETLEKSKELVLKQRILKTNLEKQGFNFVISGNVRPQKIMVNGKTKIIFKEKGVDVKIAVDIVANACDGNIKTIILCSSDSDLQPAIKEARERNIEIIYLGFELNPNKGLSYTTNRTILIRNSEVIETYKKNNR